MDKLSSSVDEVYEEMEVPRRHGELEREQVRLNRRFRLYLSIWLLFMASIVLGVYYTWARYVLNPDPLLKGPPQLVLLALIVALSAYLRQVRSNAVEQRDQIAGGKIWNYPLDKPFRVFTECKLAALDNVANKLILASPFFIFLFMVLAIRACVDAFDRLRPSPKIPGILLAVDFAILVWIAVAFIFLTVLHFVSRLRDDRIRAIAREFEPDIRARILQAQIPNPDPSNSEKTFSSPVDSRGS